MDNVIKSKNKIIVKIFPVFNKTLQSITKIWEKVVDKMMIQCTSSQFGFMSTTDVIFTPKQTIEKDREGQTNIKVTFLGLEKALHTQGGAMEILKGTKCSGKYIRLIQDMYQGCKTVVRSAQCDRGEQQLWCGCRTSSRLGHKPII